MITVVIEGGDRAAAAITRARDTMLQRIRDAVMDSTLAVQGAAKLRCPADTGRLRNSIAFQIDPDGEGSTVGTDVAYAQFVEFGSGRYREGGGGRQTPWVYYSPKLKRFVRTVGNRPRPFLAPAAREETPKLEKRLQDILRDAGAG